MHRYWCGFFAVIILIFIGCGKKPSIQLSSEAQELVYYGISLHELGEYEAAIEYYKQAMELAPDHPEIYYQMGFSYIALRDYESALLMAEKGLSTAKAWEYTEIIPPLLDLKGSVLNYLGRSEEAVNIYLELINQYGVSTAFVYYNLGVSYYHVNKLDEASQVLVKSLEVNPSHADSNYLLGRVNMENLRKTQAFFALCYFLLLEPNTERAAVSYNTILHMLSNQDETIGFLDNGAFTPADIIISVAFTLDEMNFRLSEEEKIQAKLHFIFTNLEEQNNNGKINRMDGDELWWDFYLPFFYRIVTSEYFITFCKYIGITANPDADNWIKTKAEEIERFIEWLNEFETLKPR